jgi:hypothetical protein
MIDGESGLAPGRTQKIACPRFARRIHSVADCRTETGGVGPLVEDPVGKRGEEALNLAVEAATPPPVEALQRHHLDEE